jgi:hypothetical protein
MCFRLFKKVVREEAGIGLSFIMPSNEKTAM